jgi:hypothetical protein
MPGPLIGRRRETGWAGGEARERPVFPARSVGLPWAVLGTGDGAVQPRPGSVPVVLPGRRQVRAAHRADAAWPPVPGGQGASRWLLPGGAARAVCRRPGVRGGRIEVIVAWRRARRPGRLCRRHQPPPGDAGQTPRCRGLAPSRIRRWCAHRVPLMPATGSGRDAVPGPAPEDRPAPPPGPPGVGMIPARPSPAPSPPWPGSGGAARASPELPAWPGGTGAGGLPVPPAGSR